MPRTVKSRKSFLYTFLIAQLLLNVTFSNCAVIGREKREIAANVTGITTSNNELDSATVITQEDVGISLFGTDSRRDGITTGKSFTDATTTDVSEVKKEDTTLTGSTVDENTVSFAQDDEESHSDIRGGDRNGGEDVVASTINVDDNTTKVSLSEESKTAVNEETFTVDDAISQSINNNSRSEDVLTTEHGSVLNEEISVTDEGILQSTAQIDDTRDASESGSTLKEETSTTDGDAIQPTITTNETMSQSTVNLATIFSDVKQDETTSFKTIDEGTTFSTIKPDEITSISTGNARGEATEVSTQQSSDDISTTFITSKHHEDLTGDSQTSEVSVISSTPLSVEDQILTDGTNTWASTIKSDETTAILTSTETSDESPIQTTFYASPLQDPSVGQEIKNSTPSSAEKRGKFIDDNYSSPNELRLPNTSDVWALAGMKSVGKMKSSELQNSVETSDEKVVNNSMVTKNLLDWSRVMMSTDAMRSETTIKVLEIADSTTSEVPTVKTTTEMRTLQENEVETLTTKSPTDATTDVLNLTDRVRIEDSTPLKENEVDTKTLPKFETTTSLDDREEESTPERFTMDDSSLPQTDEIMSTTKSSLNLLKGRDDAFIEDNKVEGDSIEEEEPSPTITTTSTTTTTTPIPDIVTMKSETTNPPVNGETTEEENTGTISTSTLSLLDFTTAMPFLTSTTMTTTTTTATPPISFNMDDRTNEPPNMESTLTPSQSSPAAAIVEPATTTTTTTTSPAVTVMAATTETQTTEAHTPAIISNDTMTQKGNNYNNYEVVNKTTQKSTDNSSIEATEASTRVSPTGTAITAETSATDVDRLNYFDVTTASNFDNNNAYEIVTQQTSTTVASALTVAPTIIPIATTSSSSSSTSAEDLDHIDSIQKISDTAETAIESNVIDPLQAGEASTTTTTTTTTTPTESSEENMRMQSTGRGGLDSSSTTTSTARYDDSMTTLQSISTKKEDVYSIVPTIDSGFHVPKLVVDDTTTTISGELAAGGGQPMDPPDAQETDVNVIIAISVSVVGIVALILLVAFLYVMRKRQKQMSYGQRCRPVSLDAYSLDNVSVYNSVRRKGAALRASKRSYGNVAFDDPSLRHNVLGTHELAKYVEKKSSIWEEFKDVPQIIARADEVPAGCEDKNRYANVIPLPETRVILQQQNSDEKSEYINANYVRGPKDTTNYYIACQAPLETTVTDFWRMIWEQNSRVIIMATDLIENGIDKCAEYLPPSVTLDNHTVFGDFQVTLKNREVKEKYAISTLMLKNTATEESREITHYWYQWPEAGVPTDEAAIIAMLLEARSSLKLYTIEPSDNKADTIITEEKPTAKSEINGNVASEKPKPPPKDQGPLTIHCSPGTGRTGTILACDIAMRCLEEPKRCVDIPQIVYSVRRGRASAVQTKEQYEFIYKVTHMYATKISNLNNDN